jgi:hypothetical protein
VEPRAGDLAAGEQVRDVGLAAQIGGDAAAAVVRRRHHRHRLAREIDAELEAARVDGREAFAQEGRVRILVTRTRGF